MTLSENASRNGYRYFHHRLGVFEVLQTNKGIRVVAGCYESPFIVLADEIKTSGVNVSKDLMGLFFPSKHHIRGRKIGLHSEESFF